MYIHFCPFVLFVLFAVKNRTGKALLNSKYPPPSPLPINMAGGFAQCQIQCWEGFIDFSRMLRTDCLEREIRNLERKLNGQAPLPVYREGKGVGN
jgi:hypothetical protein